MIELKNPSLMDTLWQSENVMRRNVILCFLGSLILIASAQIKVPIGPVPISMQSFAVLLIGASYGMRLGGATILLYLSYGIMGLPVFATGGGALILVGPTGGYLLGFYFAAVLAGFLAERGFDKSFAKMIALGLISTSVIYLLGLLQLALIIGWDKPILEYGLLPFIYGDCLKILLVAAVIRVALKKLEQK